MVRGSTNYMDSRCASITITHMDIGYYQFEKKGLKMYTNINLCSKCDGKCCHTMPGSVYPQQLKGNMKNNIIKLLLKGYTFDSWEGDPRSNKDEYSEVFFLRPAQRGHLGKILHRSWGGLACIFLSNTGCALSEDSRPLGCQLLEPGESECISHAKGKNDKHAAAMAWLKYQKLIKNIINRGSNGE